jgi:uncharacterized protein YndB with AHSA1/START domain
LRQKASVTCQIHEIYIGATPKTIWEAVTTPEWTSRYGYCNPAEYYLRLSGKYRATATEQMRAMGLPQRIFDGEVADVDPPPKLARTLRFLSLRRTRPTGSRALLGRLSWGIGLFAGSA